MPIHFKHTERLAGYAATAAKPGEKVCVCYRELIGPEEALHLQRQLENMQSSLFSRIPALPIPSLIDHLLVVIQPDLQCTAYVNELDTRAQVRATRSVEKGSPIYVGDIDDVTSVDVGVQVPPDCGVLMMRSLGWKRSLFFDFGPLLADVGPRTYPIEQAFAQQTLLLLGIPGSMGDHFPSTRIGARTTAIEASRMVDAMRVYWIVCSAGRSCGHHRVRGEAAHSMKGVNVKTSRSLRHDLVSRTSRASGGG